MQNRNWIMLAVAVAIGLFAVLIANAWFSGMEDKQDQSQQQQSLARIAVASQPLAFGDRLTDQNVRLQDWPAASVPEGAFRSLNEAMKNNRVAVRPLVPGEPVLASNVSGTDGRATLAAVLPSGMRAVSIAVDATSGVAGFVLPGTTVDVILTRKIPGAGATSEDLRADIILESVQVLAVDQSADDKKSEPKVSKNVTVAVLPRDAQRLAIAESMGTLSLALRKVEDAGAIEAASTVTSRTIGGPVMVIAGRSPAGAPQAGAYPAYLPATAARVPVTGGPLAPVMGAASGPSMIVVRGTEVSSYPVTQSRGW